MTEFKKMKLKVFHKTNKTKLVIKLIEELSELQKELLKGRKEKAIQEMGDVKALLKMFSEVFECKEEIKKATKYSLSKWREL